MYCENSKTYQGRQIWFKDPILTKFFEVQEVVIPYILASSIALQIYKIKINTEILC